MAVTSKWLHTARTPASSLTLGLLWLVLALAQCWRFFDHQSGLRLGLAVVSSLLALSYLVPVPLRLRQGERFRSPRATAPE